MTGGPRKLRSMVLTSRQAFVLAIIDNLTTTDGESPTMQKLCDVLGLSVSAVVAARKALVRKGYLSWPKGHSGSLRVLKRPGRYDAVGEFAAGHACGRGER